MALQNPISLKREDDFAEGVVGLEVAVGVGDFGYGVGAVDYGLEDAAADEGEDVIGEVADGFHKGLGFGDHEDFIPRERLLSQVYCYQNFCAAF